MFIKVEGVSVFGGNASRKAKQEQKNADKAGNPISGAPKKKGAS